MSSELKPEQCDAMRTLLKSARLLYANMVGCCENHHQIDHAQQGLPGWLIDCLRDIELAGPAIDTLESTIAAQAAEIERLREALVRIEMLPCDHGYYETSLRQAKEIVIDTVLNEQDARAALQGEKNDG